MQRYTNKIYYVPLCMLISVKDAYFNLDLDVNANRDYFRN